MSLKCGIVGLPNAGKSTIFNALTAARALVAPYAFSTIDPHEGITPVPDPRLKAIAELIHPDKITFATLEVWDIAGLVRGASKGEGLGNQFLGHIRNVDLIIHVVRCFEDKNIVHPAGSIDPEQDIDMINTELLLADLETISRRISKIEKLAKTGDKHAREELEILNSIESELDQGKPARRMLDRERERCPKDLQLLTAKPLLYVANISENSLQQESACHDTVIRQAAAEAAPVVTIAGKIEAELQDLGTEERREFLKEYGLVRSGLEELVQAGYQLLHLVTFYTVVSKELRAWTVMQETKAPAAAGKIHSDMERGFIKAEVVAYDDFVAAGSLHASREKGLIAIEGKDYEVKDGDIITFRFNV